MPCPFFLPIRRLDRGAWVHPPRLPLGDPYAGECHADPTAPHEPPELHQRELCNCGYARYRCSHFPEDAAADAVRFSIVSDSGASVELIYVVEKDHAPAEHGRLVYVPETDRWEGSHTSELLIRQARAFLESRGSRISRSAASHSTSG
jgi:hypothetical protein